MQIARPCETSHRSRALDLSWLSREINPAFLFYLGRDGLTTLSQERENLTEMRIFHVSPTCWPCLSHHHFSPKGITVIIPFLSRGKPAPSTALKSCFSLHAARMIYPCKYKYISPKYKDSRIHCSHPNFAMHFLPSLR